MYMCVCYEGRLSRVSGHVACSNVSAHVAVDDVHVDVAASVDDVLVAVAQPAPCVSVPLRGRGQKSAPAGTRRWPRCTLTFLPSPHLVIQCTCNVSLTCKYM